MDLVVAEWEINTLGLEFSPRNRSVHNANECNSIVLVVYNERIQQRVLYQLLHGS